MDLTTLEIVNDIFDERNPAVKALISKAIACCLKMGKYIGVSLFFSNFYLFR